MQIYNLIGFYMFFRYLYKNEIHALDKQTFKGLISLEQL